MSYQGLPPLAPKVQTCIRIFKDLQHLQTPMGRSVRASVDDHLGRFKIWSGNIGALQSLPLPTSLDYRLKEAPKTAAYIAEVLDVLIDTLEELLSVLVSGQCKHTEPHHDLPLDALTLSDAANETASLSSDQSQPQSELEELLGSCADTISGLFRSSVLIQSATSRDRYAKAAAAGDPFSEHYGIDHVGPVAAAGHSHHSESDSASRTSSTDRQNPRLHVAAFEGLEDEILHLLREGAVITEPGATWGNVLTAAIVGGHPSVVQLLLNHGARIDLHPRSFGLPLEAAIFQGDDAILEMLRRAEEVDIAVAAEFGRTHDEERIGGSRRCFAGSEVNTGTVG